MIDLNICIINEDLILNVYEMTLCSFIIFFNIFKNNLARYKNILYKFIDLLYAFIYRINQKLNAYLFY